MRWAALVFTFLAAGCALEPQQSAVYMREFDLDLLFYAVLFRDGVGETDFEPTQLNVAGGPTTEPILPPRGDAEEAWLLGWDQAPAPDGSAIRIALPADRHIARPSFASKGKFDGSILRFERSTNEIPAVALVDNDRCESIATPTVTAVDCNCGVSLSRTLCRLDIEFSGCGMNTASFRLGDRVLLADESATRCGSLTNTSTGVTEFFCGGTCTVKFTAL